LILSDFVGIKGWKAYGNKLGEYKILKIDEIVKESEDNEAKNETSTTKSSQKKASSAKAKPVAKATKAKKGKATKRKSSNKSKKDDDSLTTGDTIEFDF